MAIDDQNSANEEHLPPSNESTHPPLGTCALCRQPLTRPSAAGGCLRCIVNFVGLDVDEVSDFVAGGEEVRRYSHFEIALADDGTLAELGHGAMGTTYRAIDTVLHSPVALKVISRNVADSPAVRARFLREARTAARLRHPNVASVFHYGEQEGECFYVMELVEGETLEERVRRGGPLSAPGVLEIGLQVARALEAAEAQGLVHRDLKPSNLMLVAQQSRGNGESDETLVVKVIDFGLAKAVATDEHATEENDTRHGFVGTPAYASPEQFARDGTDARVDTRSDIYSLGVTLWYLLCGRTPFRGQTLEEIHAKQVSRALPLDQLTARRVPPPVVALLRSMLAVDPGARPQNARELLDALQRCEGSRGNAPRRKWLPIGAFVIFLLIGTVAAIFLREHPQPGTPARPPLDPMDRSVVVLPFDNLSPDPNESFFASGFQSEISSALADSNQLRVVSPESARALPPGDRDLAKISRELGAGHLVEGNVRRDGDHLAVEIKLIDPKDAAHPWTHRYEGNLSDVFGIESEITRELARRLRAPFSPGQATAPAQGMTRDPLAHDFYLRATQGPGFFKGPEEFRQALNERLALLQQAVARDPDFTLAYCVIARLHDELFDASSVIVEERAIDHRSLAEVALEKARRLQPSAGDVHKALAHHLFLVIHDPDQARIELDLARTTMPNDLEIEQMAGRIAERNGRWDEAARAFEKAAVLEPFDTHDYDELFNIYRCNRRYADADRAAAQSLAHLTTVGVVAERLDRATGPLEERADLAPLRAALAALPAELGPADVGYPDPYRLLLALCEHDPEAVLRILPLTRQPGSIGAANILVGRWVYPKAWFEGVAQRMRGDDNAARIAFAAARVELEKTVRSNPHDGRPLSLLAVTDAGLGRNEDAVREGRQACELTTPANTAVAAPAVSCQLAVVYAWTGQHDEAFTLLDDLVRHTAGKNLLFQPTYGDLRLNPVWDPLRGDARFAALVDRLAPKPTR